MEFEWNPGKNLALEAERGLTFERIVAAIGEGRLITIIDHPNAEKYAGQQMLVVDVDDYAVCVPFVWTHEGRCFPKTAFQSRKLTEIYLNKGGRTDGR